MIYDLEERTYKFAKACREFVKQLPKTIANIEYGKQLIRSSGSQAANYIEANESVGDKDFLYRIKICRKESKESGLWIKLCDINNAVLTTESNKLLRETTELRRIFNSIIQKRK